MSLVGGGGGVVYLVGRWRSGVLNSDVDLEYIYIPSVQ